MRQIINPWPEADTTTRNEPRLWRTYRRLLALPTGCYTVVQFRKVFAVNGFLEHERIQETLTDMEKEGYLNATWWKERGHMAYRVNLNSLGDVKGIDAKNDEDSLTPGSSLMNHFRDMQFETLGERKTPTVKDKALAKRLLNDVTLDKAKLVVDEYWRQLPDRRKRSNFAEFMWDFQKLLNDVLDDDNMQKLIAKEERIAARAPRTERKVAEDNLAYAIKTKDDYGIKMYTEELEELDGQE